MKKITLLALASAALASCGLKPLYAPGAAGYGSIYNHIEVLPIPGKEGYLVHSDLVDRLGEVPAGAEPTYRLQVVLDDDISGIGVRGNDSSTRERRTLRARYRLVDTQSGDLVTDATAGSDAGIDVVSSEYATIAGENTALENLADVVANEIAAEIGIAVQARTERAATAGDDSGQ